MNKLSTTIVGVGKVGTTLSACLLSKNLVAFKNNHNNKINTSTATKNSDSETYHDFSLDTVISRNDPRKNIIETLGQFYEIDASDKREAPLKYLSLSEIQNGDFSFQTKVVVITVPDSQLSTITEKLSKCNFRQGTCVFHTSGAISSQVLRPLRDLGCLVASVHPMQTFADPKLALPNLPNTYWSYEGDEQCHTILKSFVKAVQGNAVMINTSEKPLYHAASVMASNLSVSLASMAVQLLQKATDGEDRDKCLQMLLPLIKGTIKNLDGVGLPHALTGPIARGDVSTLKLHLNNLASNPEIQDIKQAYQHLSLEAVKLTEEKGIIDDVRCKKMRKSIEDSQS